VSVAVHRSLRAPALAITVAVVVASPAIARAADAGVPGELAALEKQLETEQSLALSTTDCAVACRALASMRRAADRLCEVDQNERCAGAKKKVEDAARRVREACPECTAAFSATPAPDSSRDERVSTAQAGAVPSESRRGGCAGCTTATARGSDLAATALGVLLASVLGARRRRRGAHAGR